MYIRNGDEVRTVRTHRMIEVKHGEILGKRSGGGGGVGNPAERDPVAVRDDVLNELLSVAAAREIYKVVVDPETLEIDHAESDRLRLEAHR
jgi:N-methylhydantoinase B